MRFHSAIRAIGILLVCTGQVAAADLPTKSLEQTAPLSQEERGIWAAIAYSNVDAKHGFFWGADKRHEATEIALAHCQRAGGRACTVVTVFRNHRHWDDVDRSGFPYHRCGALAVGEETVDHTTPWGAQSASTRREAEDLALQTCGLSGKLCKVREWVCT
jgi:hypothetical protein